MPRFPKLPEGTYDLSVTKAGYARTFKRVKVNCGELGEDGSVSEDIWLWEGSAEQTMRMRNVSMKLTSKDNVPIPSAEIRDSKIETRGIKRISAGVLNGKAKSLAKPPYPAAARAVKATGAVNVQVEIDEQGNVISATAVSGHPLLRQAAEKAARESSFAPTLLSGNPVKVSGILVFNFAL
jgi:TonB family protein